MREETLLRLQRWAALHLHAQQQMPLVEQALLGEKPIIKYI